MRIVINDSKDPKWGSTRIWRDWLSLSLRKNRVDVTVNEWEQYEVFDVAIFGKGIETRLINKCLQANPSIVIGLIQPDDTKEKHKKNLKLADFFVVGSIEERDYYLKYCSRVFIIPLVELIEVKPKKHIQNEQLVVGYHGNRVHLESTTRNVNKALEAISRDRNIELRAFYNIEEVGRWINTPNISVKHIQWSYPHVWQDLAKCDVGIVPASASLSKVAKFVERFPGFWKRSRSNEYYKKYKITSNAGRCFVFHQLGIPVIAGFVPSNFHILADPECGYLADSFEGWYTALSELADSAELRQLIADNAYKEFIRLYDPATWSLKLITAIKNMPVKN